MNACKDLVRSLSSLVYTLNTPPDLQLIFMDSKYMQVKLIS